MNRRFSICSFSIQFDIISRMNQMALLTLNSHNKAIWWSDYCYCSLKLSQFLDIFVLTSKNNELLTLTELWKTVKWHGFRTSQFFRREKQYLLKIYGRCRMPNVLSSNLKKKWTWKRINVCIQRTWNKWIIWWKMIGKRIEKSLDFEMKNMNFISMK